MVVPICAPAACSLGEISPVSPVDSPLASFGESTGEISTGESAGETLRDDRFGRLTDIIVNVIDFNWRNRMMEYIKVT